MPYAAATEPTCPKCSGLMWDNRATKRNPKQPDYKCKDKACEGVIWPPRPGTAPVAATPQNGKQSYSSGGPLPYETQEETGAPPAGSPRKADAWDTLFAAYDVCHDKAMDIAKKMERGEIGSTPETVAAIAATLLIQADRQGLTR